MDHDHMDPMSPPMAPMAMTKKRYTSMTFFWANKAEVLFAGWPGDSAGMYASALIVVFLLAAATEMVSSHRVDRMITGGRSLTQTAVHVLRVGLMYLLMLAVMSFNGGIFLAACVGHAAGFLLFRSAVFGGGRQQTQDEDAAAATAAAANCCNDNAGNGTKYVSDLPAMSC